MALDGLRRVVLNGQQPCDGTDSYGHFDLYDPPVKELGEKELAVHDHVYTCYAENYREQVKKHEEAFA